MKGEIEHHQDMARAAQADALLKHPLLVEAFDTLEKEYLRGFRESTPTQMAGREEMYRLLHSLERFRGHLKATVIGGKMAQQALEDIQKQSERRKFIYEVA